MHKIIHIIIVLFFFENSIMSQDYVMPYINNKDITILKIKNKLSDVIKLLEEIYNLYINDNNHYKIALNIICI